ncbi:MAG: PAS domain S-box protein [Alphaproteobacteria bacterium]
MRERMDSGPPDETGQSCCEVTALRADGSELRVYVVGRPVTWDGMQAAIVNMHDLTRRLAAETQLRESEMRFRSLFELSPEPIYVRVGDTVCYANAAMADMFGFENPQALVGSSALGLYHPDDHQTLLGLRHKLDSQAVSDDNMAQCEITCVRVDGTPLRVRMVGRPAMWDGVQGAIVNLHDITQRVDVEARLRESEARFRALVELSPDPIYVQLGGRIVYANPEMARMFGYRGPDDLAGRDALDLFTPPGRAVVLEIRQRMLADGPDAEKVYNCEVECLRADGSAFTVLGAGRLIPWHNDQAIIVQLRDVSERVAAETKLKQSEALFRSLFELSPDAVYVHVDDEIRFVNRAACALFGFDHPQAMVGHSSLSLYAAEFHDMIRALRARNKGEPVDSRYRMTCLRRDGSSFQAEATAGSAFWNGVPARVVAIRDLTEQLETQKRLMHSEKMDALGKMTSGVAHEFNNFLTVIAGFNQMALRHIDNRDRVVDSLNEVAKAASIATELVQRMLAFGRKGEIKAENVAIGRLIVEMESMLSQMVGPGVRLDVDIEAPEASAWIDPTQLAQAIVNLIRNAAQAMGGDGVIAVTNRVVDVEPALAARHDGAREGPHIAIDIVDTGPGMNDETLKRVFEPFFTTKEMGSGTGLGLAIVYGTAKVAGGFIEVESEVGRGTRFTLYLPVNFAPRRDSRAEATAEECAAFAAASKILVVEDDPAVMALTRMTLEEAGLTVIEAQDGSAGLELFERERDSIDLVLTDVRMPRLSGPEMVRSISAACPSLPIIFMSGHAAFDAEDSLLISGANGLLQKPFDPDQLCRVVMRAVGKTDRCAPSCPRTNCTYARC